MSGKAYSEEPSGENASNRHDEVQSVATGARRPYQRPVVEALGDIRDVTLGGTGTSAESGQGGTTFFP